MKIEDILLQGHGLTRGNLCRVRTLIDQEPVKFIPCFVHHPRFSIERVEHPNPRDVFIYLDSFEGEWMNQFTEYHKVVWGERVGYLLCHWYSLERVTEKNLR